MKFKLEWEMEVYDPELLEIVNDYFEFTERESIESLDQTTSKLIIEAMRDCDYISEELRTYCEIDDIIITSID